MRQGVLVLAAVGLAIGLASSAVLQSQAHSGDGISVELQARAFQPGEVILLTVSLEEPVFRAEQPVSEVMVRAFGRRVQGYPAGERRWQALVGIDIDQRAGTYPIVVELSGPSGTRRTTKPCQVWSKVFPTRTLRVDPDFVNPPAGVLARIQEEAALLRKVYEDTAASRLWRDPFVRPVEEPANSRFGSRSVYNGQRRSPHSGTDFLSGAGTPVRAPNAGHVVVARDLYFTGNTLVIDHGLGAVSLLAHLSRLDVHEGDQIRPGQIVGLVGATGRVTGPHLHWALRLAGARVDPLSALWVAGAVPSESAPLVTR